MKKLSVCIVVIISLMVGIFGANAAPATVASPMSEPEPNYQSMDNFQVAYVGYFGYEPYYKLGIFTVRGLSSSSKFCVKNGFIRASEEFLLHVDYYDIETGSLVSSQDVGQSVINHLENPVDVYYNYSYGSLFAQVQDKYAIVPQNENISILGNQSQPFVIWSENPPQTVVYHSTLAEPVADEYNRYIAIGYGDKARLYWVSIQRYQYQYTNSQTWEYEGQLQSQTLILAQSASYRLVYQVPEALDDLSYLQYVMQITEFDLETGEYKRTKAYAGTHVSQTVDIDITDFGIDPSEITSICTWGVNLINDGHLINRMSCVWSTNPAFETWKTRMLIMLEHIYDALTDESEEVTIEQETGVLNVIQDLESQMQVTDENGSAIDGAEKAEEVFSKAAEDMSKVEEPLSFVKQEIQTITAGNSVIMIPITVALALGLLVTILGRKRS